MSASLNFTLSGAKLSAKTEYAATFEWQGQGGGITGGIGAQTSSRTGKVTFQLNPTVLIAVGHYPSPGTLTLSITHPDGSPLGPGFTIVEEIA